eukprot:7991881-Alexandrium_andersonii.AAC.1
MPPQVARLRSWEACVSMKRGASQPPIAPTQVPCRSVRAHGPSASSPSAPSRCPALLDGGA